MAVQIRELRVANPHKSSGRGKTVKRSGSVKRTRGKRSKNGGLALLGPVNPYKGGNMKKKANKAGRKSNPRGRASSSSRRSAKRNPHRSRRRRNTSAVSLRSAQSMLTMGFWVIVGLILTRSIPQALFGARNTGPMGYLMNFATAIASAWAANSVGGQTAALGAGAGGAAYTVTRILQEKMNPIGRLISLQGLGDGMALGELLSGDRTYFPLPVAYDNNRNPIIPQQIRPIAPAPLPMPTASLGAYRGARRLAM